MALKSTAKVAAKKTAPRTKAQASATAPKVPAAKRIAKKASGKAPGAATVTPAQAARLIDARIADTPDWRGEALAQVRALIHAADPEVVEEVKWRGTPVWSHDGILCTGERYKDKIKLTFARGAALPDPKRLFNASLEGNTRRALDIFEQDTLDAAAFKALIKAAVQANVQAAQARKRR